MTITDRLNIFRKASICRNFEEVVYGLIQKKTFKFPIYLSAGQEFIPAALSEAFRNQTPLLFAQHRCHHTYLSFGGHITQLVDELLGKPTGCAGGMGGSASIQSKDIGMFGHDGLMGSQIPIAVGACFASKKFTIAFMGDASGEEDYVLSSIQWAAHKKIPILFVVEDNNLSILTEKKVRRSWRHVDFAGACGIRALDIEDDPAQIMDAAKGELPALLNIHTERLFWHVGAGQDPEKKRDRYQIEMDAIGKVAKDIHSLNRQCVELLWKQRLETQ